MVEIKPSTCVFTMPTRVETDGAPSFALPVVRAVEGVRDFITDLYGLLILICLNVGV